MALPSTTACARWCRSSPARARGPTAWPTTRCWRAARRSRSSSATASSRRASSASAPCSGCWTTASSRSRAGSCSAPFCHRSTARSTRSRCASATRSIRAARRFGSMAWMRSGSCCRDWKLAAQPFKTATRWRRMSCTRPTPPWPWGRAPRWSRRWRAAPAPSTPMSATVRPRRLWPGGSARCRAAPGGWNWRMKTSAAARAPLSAARRQASTTRRHRSTVAVARRRPRAATT